MSERMAESRMETMFTYDADALKQLLAEMIQQSVSPDVWNWLQEKKEAPVGSAGFNTAFAAMPRKTGKARIRTTDEQNQQIQNLRPHFTIQNWPIDRLCRVWLLLQADASDKDQYVRAIENLSLTAEMSELVALYSALPVLPYPEQWRRRCAEGIRSNIGDVLQAIMCHNPYPSEQLEEPAWNQLVLKAFFTDKPIHQIVNLDQRANRELAHILSDYAHERWAAHRPVHPQLWRCVGPFIDEQIFPDIQRIAQSDKEVERKAAALACWHSSYPPAKELLNQHKDLKAAIEAGTLSWESLAQEMSGDW